MGLGYMISGHVIDTTDIEIALFPSTADRVEYTFEDGSVLVVTQRPSRSVWAQPADGTDRVTAAQMRTLVALGGDVPGWADALLLMDAWAREDMPLPLPVAMKMATGTPLVRVLHASLPDLWPLLCHDRDPDVTALVRDKTPQTNQRGVS